MTSTALCGGARDYGLFITEIGRRGVPGTGDDIAARLRAGELGVIDRALVARSGDLRFARITGSDTPTHRIANEHQHELHRHDRERDQPPWIRPGRRAKHDRRGKSRDLTADDQPTERQLIELDRDSDRAALAGFERLGIDRREIARGVVAMTRGQDERGGVEFELR